MQTEVSSHVGTKALVKSCTVTSASCSVMFGGMYVTSQNTNNPATTEN